MYTYIFTKTATIPRKDPAQVGETCDGHRWRPATLRTLWLVGRLVGRLVDWLQLPPNATSNYDLGIVCNVIFPYFSSTNHLWLYFG